jgi:Vacuolar protein sorting-associated protein 26
VPSNGEFAYEASQDIKGKVILTLPSGKKADHLGIKIQFIGRIDMVRTVDILHPWPNALKRCQRPLDICWFVPPALLHSVNYSYTSLINAF